MDTSLQQNTKEISKIAQGKYVCSGCHTRAGEDVPMVKRSKKKMLLKTTQPMFKFLA